MKMKKACEATALTERAIRLYLSRNLITPRHENGIIDFSNEDIQRLKDIAVLRQFDFTIEQISSMIYDAAAIPDILQVRTDSANSGVAHEKEVFTVLGTMEEDSIHSIHAVADHIRRHRSVPPEPDFTRFDEISDEQRQQERLLAIKDLTRRETRARILEKCRPALIVLAILAVISVVYLASPRVEGFIPAAPLTVLSVNADETATFLLEDEWVKEIVGRDTVTVPYHYFIKLEEGKHFDHACQLSIKLTNYDLLRIGVNPLQSFKTRNENLNKEWIQVIMQSLFENGLNKKAEVWLLDTANVQPLLQRGQ